MRFAVPQILWILAAVLPLLLWFLAWTWRRKRLLVAAWVHERLLPDLSVGVSLTRQKLRLGLLAAAVASLFLALARPQWGFAWEEVRQRGLDIVVGIDTSRSMLATDVAPNRLARAKLAALDLLRLARHDRLGLVTFAGTAFLQCPLTLDDEAFRQSVQALDTAIMPQGGTALADAINAALSAFKDGQQNHKILVLITDGEDHDGGATDAARRAAASGLRIFTVGIGTPEGELLVLNDGQGNREYVKDDAGNIIKSRLNERLLAELATEGNGFYLPLRGANPMEVLYEKGLAPLPKSEFEARLIRHYHERYQWPLALAILLLLIELLLPDRRTSAPSRRKPTSATRTVTAALAGSLLLSLTATARGSTREAQELYRRGQFQEALQAYDQALEKQPEDPRLNFNSGAAAYRAGEFDQAIRRFQHGTQSPDLPLQQRSYYNLGNAYYRAGELQPDPKRKTAEWETAIKHFESALKLDAQDTFARDNLDFVRRQLEALKQQQSQPNPSQDSPPEKDPSDNQNQEQQSSKPDSSESQQPQQDGTERPTPPPSKPDQSSPKPPPEEKQSSSPEPDSGESQSASPPRDERGADSPGQQDRQEGPPATESEANAQGVPLGQMTREQAAQLLDRQRGEEKAMIFRPPESARPKRRTFKDW
jgi:Ca-activated chloride channel family protein